MAARRSAQHRLVRPGAGPVTAVIADWFATLITTLALHEITLYVSQSWGQPHIV